MKKKLLCLALCTLLFGAFAANLGIENPPGWGMSNKTINQLENPSANV